jgi:hypothetical protein
MDTTSVKTPVGYMRQNQSTDEKLIGQNKNRNTPSFSNRRNLVWKSTVRVPYFLDERSNMIDKEERQPRNFKSISAKDKI